MGMSVLIAAVMLLTAAGPQEKPSREAVESSAKKVKDLQKERIETLKAASEVSAKLATAGRLEIRAASNARIALLKAELDAAEKESDRAALYKEALDSLSQFEAQAKAAKEAGRATDLDRLAIKACRLEVEIWQEQAKIKAAK